MRIDRSTPVIHLQQKVKLIYLMLCGPVFFGGVGINGLWSWMGLEHQSVLLKGTLEMFGGTEISNLLCSNVIFRHGCGVAGHNPCVVQDGVISLTDSFQTTTR